MKASEALAKLKQAVNIGFYLNPEELKAIETACSDKATTKTKTDKKA